MDSSQPVVRYYDVRPKHRWYLGIVPVLVLGFVAWAWFGTDLLRAESPAAGGGVVTVAGAFDEQAGVEGATPPATVGADDDRIDATKMAMVGDSITEGSADAIRYTLTAEGFTAIDIDGVTSRRIEEGDGKVSPLSGVATLYGMLGNPEIDPDVWVIALGTNDVGQYAEDADYRRLIQSVLDMIPDGVPLVWVNTFRSDKPEASVTFNSILFDEVSRREHSVVASWYDQASRDDETRVLRDDGVHPNQHGRVVFAALVAEGIAAVT
ncbi:MAG: GDSL-type esterase/lipase family protein [Ilumatobacteraceae bacterium]